MTALDHALRWINGELVAGGAVIAFGLLLVGCSGLLWRFGESTAARAMVLPLLVTGGLITVLSAVAAFNNVLHIAEFREAYAAGGSFGPLGRALPAAGAGIGTGASGGVGAT